MDVRERLRRKKIKDLEAQERDLLAKRRVLEQRKRSLAVHGITSATDRRIVEVTRALLTNANALANVRIELHQAKRLA